MATMPERLELSALHDALSADLKRRFARRGVPLQDQDDLVQEVFLRAHRARDELRDGERRDAWLARIAQNVLVDWSRRTRRALPSFDGEDPAAPSEAVSLTRVAASWLPAAIDALPEHYSEVLRLADLEQVSHKEIAARLGLSIPAVKSRVSRGRVLLRDVIDACCVFVRDTRGGLVDFERRDGPCGCDGNRSR